MKRIIPVILLGIILVPNIGCLTRDYNLRAIHDTNRNYVTADSTDTLMKWRTKSWSDDKASVWSSASVIVTSMENVFGGTPSDHWLKEIKEDGINPFKGMVLVDFDLEKINASWYGKNESDLLYKLYNLLAIENDYVMTYVGQQNDVVNHTTGNVYVSLSSADRNAYLSSAIALLAEEIEDVRNKFGATDLRVGVYFDYPNLAWQSYTEDPTTVGGADPFGLGKVFTSYTTAEMDSFHTYYDEVISALDANNVFVVVGGDRLDNNILSGSVIDRGEIEGVFIDDVSQSNYTDVISKVGGYRDYYPTSYYPTASLMLIAGVKENSYTADASGYATMIKALIDNGIYFTPGNDDGTSYFNYPRDNVMSWWRRVDDDIQWQTNPNVPEYESYTVHPTRIWGNSPSNVVLVDDDSEGESVNGASIVSYSITSYDSTGVGGEWILGLDVEYDQSVDIYAKFGGTIQEAQADTPILLSSSSTTYSGTQSTGITIPPSSYTDDLIVLLYSTNEYGSTSTTTQISYTTLRQLDIASIGNDLIDPYYWDVPTINFALGNVYYFDPSAATMGDGSRANPFQSLDAALSAGLIAKYTLSHTDNNSTTSIVDEGDVCVLLAGNHGTIHFDRYFFDNWIGVVADPYAAAGTVQFDNMRLNSGEYFYVEGLTASGLGLGVDGLGVAEAEEENNPYYIKIEGDSPPNPPRFNVVIKDCDLSYSTVDDVTTWTESDWTDNVPNGIRIIYRDGVLLQNNTMSVIGFGLLATASQNIEVYGSGISNICYDGIQVDRVDNTRIKSNQLYDFFDVSDNHNDAIQSFSTGAPSAADPIDGFIVDSNIFIHKTTDRGDVADGNDADELDQNSQLQLIANSTEATDRNMVNAIYMNNVLIGEDNRVGISLRAATSPVVANNTFAPHFANSGPSISLSTEWPTTDARIINNVVTTITDGVGGATTTTNYLFGSNPSQAMFTEWSNTMLPTEFNLVPLADSPLVDGGTTVLQDTMTVDINGDVRLQGNAYDIGAYETGYSDSPEIQTFIATSADSLEQNSTQYWATDLYYVGDRVADVEFTFELDGVTSDPYTLRSISSVTNTFQTTIPTTTIYAGTMNVGLTVTTDNGLTVTDTRQINVTRYVDTTPPDTPTNLTVADVGDQYVTLEWYDVLIPGGYYNVYRSAPNDARFDQYLVIDVPENPQQQSSSYTDTDLTNDSVYYYYVTAVDNSGNESVETGTVSATPTAPVVPEDDPATITFNILDAGQGGADPDSSGGNWVLYVRITSNENDVDGVITFNEIEQFESTGGIPSQKDFPQMIESSITEITFGSEGYEGQMNTGVLLTATTSNTIWASAYFTDSGGNRTPPAGTGSLNVSVPVNRAEDPLPIFNSFTMSATDSADGFWKAYLDIASNETVATMEARFATTEAGLSSATWQTVASSTSTYSDTVTTDVALFEMGTLWAQARLTDAVDGDLATQNTSTDVVREDKDITFTDFVVSNATTVDGNWHVDVDATLDGGSGTVEVRFSDESISNGPGNPLTWIYPVEAQYTSPAGQESIGVDGVNTGIPSTSTTIQSKITAIKVSGSEYSDETYVDVTAPGIAAYNDAGSDSIGGNWRLESFVVDVTEEDSDIEYVAISFGGSPEEAMAIDPMDTLVTSYTGDLYRESLGDSVNYDTGVSIADRLSTNPQTIYPYIVAKNTSGLTSSTVGAEIVLDRADDITDPTNSSFAISNASAVDGNWHVDVDATYSELGTIAVKFADSEGGLSTATSQTLGSEISSYSSPPKVDTGLAEYTGDLWASIEMVDIAGNSSGETQNSMSVETGVSAPPDGLVGEDATYYFNYIVEGPPILFWNESVGVDYYVIPYDSTIVYTEQDTLWYWNYRLGDIYTNERVHLLAKKSETIEGLASVSWDTVGTNNIWNPGSSTAPADLYWGVGGGRYSNDSDNAYVIASGGVEAAWWSMSRSVLTEYLTSETVSGDITYYVSFAVQDYDTGTIVEATNGSPFTVTLTAPSLYTDYMNSYFASWNEVAPTLTMAGSSYDSTNDFARFNVTSNNEVRLFYRHRVDGGEWTTTAMTDTLSTNQWILIPTNSVVNGSVVELGVKGRDIYYNTSEEIYDSVTVVK